MPILKQIQFDKDYRRKRIQYEGQDDRKESGLHDSYKYYEKEIKWADRIYYGYFKGEGEGGGDALILYNGKRGAFDLGHCSCYGPFEYVKKDKCNLSFEDALANSGFSEGMKNKILIDRK